MSIDYRISRPEAHLSTSRRSRLFSGRVCMMVVGDQNSCYMIVGDLVHDSDSHVSIWNVLSVVWSLWRLAQTLDALRPHAQLQQGCCVFAPTRLRQRHDVCYTDTRMHYKNHSTPPTSHHYVGCWALTTHAAARGLGHCPPAAIGESLARNSRPVGPNRP